MTLLIILIIYMSFISLGLPDSLFGSSWPILQLLYDVPVSYAGFATMTVSICTIISSLFSEKLTSKLSAGIVTTISVLLTAIALIGISYSTEFYMLILWSMPLGFGAGAIDAALNNYAALHFSSKHMNWLHCMWGIGASISPYIMSYFLSKNSFWQGGYRCIGIIQLVITAILFISLPIWKKNSKEKEIVKNDKPKTFKEVFSLKGILFLLIAFLCYCAVESTIFSWTSSYLVIGKNFKVEDAAMYSSMFYIGMTSSRLLCGFISDKLGNTKMIRLGYLIIAIGLAFILIPFNIDVLIIIGLFIIGFGCGPIYPSIVHSIPSKFGKEYSLAVVGIAMSFAYCGSTFMPPLFGIIANHIDINLFPIYLSILAILGFILIEICNKKVEKSI